MTHVSASGAWLRPSFTLAEYQDIEVARQHSDQSLSDFARDALSAALGDLDARYVSAMIDMLNTVGQSYNDAAHSANSVARRYGRAGRLGINEWSLLVGLLRSCIDSCAQARDGLAPTSKLARHVVVLQTKFPTHGSWLSERIGFRATRKMTDGVDAAVADAPMRQSTYLRGAVVAAAARQLAGDPPDASYALSTDAELAALDVAIGRWETNARQCRDALMVTKRAQTSSRYVTMEQWVELTGLLRDALATSREAYMRCMGLTDAFLDVSGLSSYRRVHPYIGEVSRNA